MSPPDPEGAPLPSDRLDAVSELWARTGRELRVRFTGRSMEPTIRSGAEVTLLCGEGGRVGDIVAVRAGLGVIVHRVVAAGPGREWLVTRGDARWLPDAPSAGAGAVLGRVAAVHVEAVAADPPALHPSLGQRLALAPLLAVLRVHPATGLAALRALVHARRLALRAATPLRRRLRAATAR